MTKVSQLLIFLTFVFVSCVSKSSPDSIPDSDYEVTILRKELVNSINAIDSSKCLNCYVKAIELDSSFVLQITLPLGKGVKKHFSSSRDMILSDSEVDESRSFEEETNSVFTFEIASLISDNTQGIVRIEKSKDSTLYQVDNIIKLNSPHSILYRDHNSLIFFDRTGDAHIFVRGYDFKNEIYYIFTSEVDNLNDKSIFYENIFKTYNIGFNLLNTKDLNVIYSWDEIKPSLYSEELALINKYYNSLLKDIKYFIRSDSDYSRIKILGETFVFKSDDENLFDNLMKLEKGTYLNEYSLSSVGLDQFFTVRFRNPGRLSSVNRLSSSTLLVNSEIGSYDDDSPKYFPKYIIYSMKIPEGLFYLVTESDEDIEALNISVNNYFVDNLHL